MFKLKHGIIARFNSCTVASNGPALSITLEFPDGVTGTSTRQKTLYASTEEDRAEWLESIDKCCAHSSINNRYLIDRANPLGKGPPPRALAPPSRRLYLPAGPRRLLRPWLRGLAARQACRASCTRGSSAATAPSGPSRRSSRSTSRPP